MAAAISVGGAGCVFWIWICALISSVTKYVESVLAVRYRGGPWRYIKDGLGCAKISILFCLLCILTAFAMGNATQVKSAADFFCISSGAPRFAVATVFFISVLLLTSGKGKRIISFTSRAVPLLCIAYTVLCIFLIFSFKENIIPVTRSIFAEAFSMRAGMGGAIGILCSPALRLGITRGIMSNEAGCGTSPIAYSLENPSSPVRCGLLGVCEVLVDTLLLCTLTAYALLCPGVSLSCGSANAVILAFSSVYGANIAHILAVFVFLFALASVGTWAFYATEASDFLGLKGVFKVIFPPLYATCSFFGCFATEGLIWTLADIFVSLMAIVNVTAITLLLGKVYNVTKSEFKKYKSTCKADRFPKP